jgi:hypothetical protein
MIDRSLADMIDETLPDPAQLPADPLNCLNSAPIGHI